MMMSRRTFHTLS